MGLRNVSFVIMIIFISVSNFGMSVLTVPRTEHIFHMSLADTAKAESLSDADSLATADLAEIDRKLNNPLTDLWSMVIG